MLTVLPCAHTELLGRALTIVGGASLSIDRPAQSETRDEPDRRTETAHWDSVRIDTSTTHQLALPWESSLSSRILLWSHHKVRSLERGGPRPGLPGEGDGTTRCHLG